MSQNPSVDPSTRSVPQSTLHPVLQAALGSLDVQLEEELARYRRQRSGRPVMSPRGLSHSRTTRKPLEWMPLNRENQPTQPPALSASKAPELSIPLTFNPTPKAVSAPETPRTEIPQTTHQQELATDPPQPLDIPSPEVNEAEADVGEYPIHTGEGMDEDENLVPTASTQTQPEDYLESSEQLLRSLADEEEATSPPPKKSFVERVFTPLGVGSFLLLLLSGGTLIYILANPTLRSALGLERLFGSQPPMAQSPVETSENGESQQDSSVLSGPDLASEEFTDLDLNNLSRVETDASQSPSLTPVPSLPDLPEPEVTQPAPAAPRSSDSGSSADLSSSLIPPNLQPPTTPPAPAPTAPAPAARPSASAPPARPASPAPASPSRPAASPKPTEQSAPASSSEPVAASPPSSQDNYYYVLTDYSSDRNLEQARDIVPDAYVRNFPQGTRIQMGAFRIEAEAKSLVEQLQQQGISASIYRP